MKLDRIAAAACAAALAAAPVVAADLTIVYKTSGAGGRQRSTPKIAYSSSDHFAAFVRKSQRQLPTCETCWAVRRSSSASP